MTKRITRRSVLAGSAALAVSASAVAQRPPARPKFGINLSGPVDWNTEQAFVNAFRQSRPWVSQREGSGWGQGPELDLDPFGWVRRLERGCAAETLLCSIDDGHYPSGLYTVLYDGVGEIRLRGAASTVSSEPGRVLASVDATRGGSGLLIEATDPRDYLRNIRVMMPGFESRTDMEPFRPNFLDRWHGVACLRFMDWMHTNGSEITRWSQRPTLMHATYAERGVALEAMINLANTLEADAWFCMPHLANDDYVRNFALTVAAELNSNRRIYVEYSNEVWNSTFLQSSDARARGKQLGLSRNEWEAAWRYTAYRSKRIFDIWHSELGRDGRLVCVLPSHAASTRVSEEVLGFQDAYRSADALAIAPYMTCIVRPGADAGLSAEAVRRWSVDQALDYMEESALPQAAGWIADHKAIADRHGLKLVAYEAGQHMVGVFGAENDETITRLFQDANAHPRMGEIYRRFYESWANKGGDLLCGFTSVERWGKYGSWGLVQYADDDPAQSPKYRASIEWARQCGQPMGER